MYVGTNVKSILVYLLILHALSLSAQQSNILNPNAALFQGIYMTRSGSGSSWLPSFAPMDAFGFQHGNTSIMLHTTVFGRYLDTDINQAGSRGQSGFSFPNWMMAAFAVDLGKYGQPMFRVMLSLDPLTIGGAGYPLLFQTGETWQNKPLVDRQHPHDLISELSIGYSKSITPESGIFLYAAYPGEPALGPPAFMHRPSARNNPDAPLSHHLQDATHILFGVISLGAWIEPFKFDASLFNGDDPDENRYLPDPLHFNSSSIRISFCPTRETTAQISYGLVDHMDMMSDDGAMSRITMSLLYSAQIFDYAYWDYVHWDTSFIVGMDIVHGVPQHSVLYESDFQVQKTSLFSRFELIEKEISELDIPMGPQDSLAGVSAMTFGVAQQIFSVGNTGYSGMAGTLGFKGTIHLVPKGLQTIYGKNPISVEVFLKIYSDRMRLPGH